MVDYSAANERFGREHPCLAHLPGKAGWLRAAQPMLQSRVASMIRHIYSSTNSHIPRTGVPKPEVGFRTSEPPPRRRSASGRGCASRTKKPDSAWGSNSCVPRIGARRNLGRIGGSLIFKYKVVHNCVHNHLAIGILSSCARRLAMHSAIMLSTRPVPDRNFKTRRTSPAHIRRSRSERRCP